VMAYQRMQQCRKDKLAEVIGLFTETALEIGEGQQYDMDFEHRNDVSEDEYIEMIRLKTSVLIACAIKIGVILADAPSDDADNLYKFGELFGLAFQLQDDYLDVYGDPKLFGKEIGGDIMCNKKTYMLINAFNRADEAQKQELTRWITMENPVRSEKVAAVTALYDAIGIKEMARKKMDDCFDEALTYLNKVKLPAGRKATILEYTKEMMNRQF